MNIGFYVSGRATRLKNIIQNDYSDINHSVRLVVSDEKNDTLEELLKENHINYRYFGEDAIQDNVLFSDKLLNEMKKNKIDYLFVFGKKLLKGTILTEYRNRMINFHPSILPLFPGYHAIDKAVEAHMTVLGNTAHFIDESVDQGPIILQTIISIDVFREEGYEGILKYQEKMFFIIFDLLKQDRIVVEKNNSVTIKQSRKKNFLFIPTIDF